MTSALTIRPLQPQDYAAWRVLWDDYNAFYGRSGPTALAENITETTWQRLLNANEPVHGLVAESAGAIVGMTHHVFHRSTTRLMDVCYLHDLYTLPHLRGQGIGRRLIEAVYEAARQLGSSRVYWTTKPGNAAARILYDKVAKDVGFMIYSQEI